MAWAAPVWGRLTGWAVQPGMVTCWDAKAGALLSAPPPPSQMVLSGSASAPTRYWPGAVLETSIHW